MIAEEPVNRSLLINKPAAEKPKPVQTQSFASSLKGDGIMIGGSSKATDLAAAKKPTMESEITQEAPIKKDNKPDFGIKAEPVKISSILGGSSIFAQPKSAAAETATTNGTGSSLFGGKKQETEEPKKATEAEPAAKEETIQKESSPKVNSLLFNNFIFRLIGNSHNSHNHRHCHRHNHNNNTSYSSQRL